MTIEELKELKKTVRAGFYVDDTDGDEEFFKVINQSDEIRILELIDEKISQLSVTDEDVQRAIEWVKSVKEHSSVVLDEIKQNEPNVSPMLYEKRKKHASVLITALQQMQPVSGDTSDGYHTFNELYHHRAILFAVICNQNRKIAWKSKNHYDGTMFANMFIVGIDTPYGQATYHYDVKPYWDMFHVKQLDYAPKWDGHTAEQAINRLQKFAEVSYEVKYGL